MRWAIGDRSQVPTAAVSYQETYAMAVADDEQLVPASDERREPVVAPAAGLYGREADLVAVLGSGVPVLLLTGDSGIGKSELLSATQQARASVTSLPPRTLRATSGSLQRAILDCLADATAELARERGLSRELSERLVAAGKKLLRTRARRRPA